MITTAQNVSLKHLNTLGIDCTCRLLITYTDLSDLPQLYDQHLFQGKWLHLGAGANTLFDCRHFDGTVIKSACQRFEASTVGNVRRVRAENGWLWDALVQHMLDTGCYGAENLSGIPASAGGAVVQNIGAYGMEIQRLLAEVTVFDTLTGTFTDIPAEECGFAYRKSMFKRRGCPLIVVKGLFNLYDAESWKPCLEYAALRELESDGLTPQMIRKAVLYQRDSKLPNPSVLGNAGSFFINPVVSADKATELAMEYPGMPQYAVPDGVKLSAGWLIDHAGLKGYRMGRAGVDSRNALVLVNHGDATGEDMLMLAAHVMDTVEDRFGVRLTPEVLVVS